MISPTYLPSVSITCLVRTSAVACSGTQPGCCPSMKAPCCCLQPSNVKTRQPVAAPPRSLLHSADVGDSTSPSSRCHPTVTGSSDAPLGPGKTGPASLPHSNIYTMYRLAFPVSTAAPLQQHCVPTGLIRATYFYLCSNQHR